MKVAAYEELKVFLDKYDLIPVMAEDYSDTLTPILVLRKLKATQRDCFLLESVEGGEKVGRYSFLGYAPSLRIYSEKETVVIEESGQSKRITTSPITFLKEFMKQHRSPKIEGLPTFTGGLVGYFTYEMYQMTEERVPMKTAEVPLFDLMLFDKVIAFDHLMNRILILVNLRSQEGEEGYRKAEEEIFRLHSILYDNNPLEKLTVLEQPKFKCNVSREQYYEMVEKTKKHIFEGDIFQGVISRRFETEYHSSLMNTYRVMRTINPSSYMYYIKCKDIEIAGVSPETMVKLVDGKLTTFPVAGTRKRGRTKEEDLALEEELLADEKECAEHNMLVDLARNDIGRIACYGSVKVEEYMKIHRFSKVMHIASVVTGQLRPELDGVDAITAMLPAGTLSGAPKIRACEIIYEIEPTPRGVYGGAIGYLDFSGNVDVCIGIRTAVKQKNHVYVQAGAGIVADSIPEKEYEECENKAKAVLEAIMRAGEVNEA